MRCPCCGSPGPCYCYRNRPARNRDTGYRPARRAQPGTPAGNGGPVFLICLMILVAGFWPAMVWHGYGGPEGTSWRWDIHSTIACLIWWGLTIVPLTVAAVISAGRKRKLGRAAPEAARAVTGARALTAEAAKVPEPPVCRHLNAVRVDSVLDPKLVWQCWCPDCDPDCETPLPADFRRPCCGTEPEAPHLYNCPETRQ